MVTDFELGKSGGKECRVAREEISVDAIQDVVNLYSLNDESLRISLPWLNISHQKCDVSIFEEVFVVPHE